MNRKNAAFTLTEIMISTTVLAVMMSIFMGLYLDMNKVAFTSDAKNLINRDIRNITLQWSRMARESSYFVLYSSWDTDARDAPADRLAEGKSGDFVVFVTLDPISSDAVTTGRTIESIVGYYRDAIDPNKAAPVRSFRKKLTTNDKSLTLEKILPVQSSSTNHDQVIELSEGLADGRLFYNLWNTSVMVNGRILHGNAAKWITDTYNLTISPRGIQQ